MMRAASAAATRMTRRFERPARRLKLAAGGLRSFGSGPRLELCASLCAVEVSHTFYRPGEVRRGQVGQLRPKAGYRSRPGRSGWTSAAVMRYYAVA